MLTFNENNYEVKSYTFENRTITYREYKNVLYVGKPICEDYQNMNIFIPEAYYHNESIGKYNAENAPIFMPNKVGGYMPGKSEEPERNARHPEKATTTFYALEHGYVVCVPCIRGRGLKVEDKNIGTAPAFIVDYKAAIRFVHWLGHRIPGDKNKIFTNGTSAGGALSSLAGSTIDHPDYDGYLKEIEAADTTDSILGASCYCPITNLDHADMAYEWEFDEIYDYHRAKMKLDEGGRPSFTPVDGVFNEEEKQVSKELKSLFPTYLNSLHLKENGKELTLDENGNGSFKEGLKQIVVDSANTFISKGNTLDKDWLIYEDGKVVDIDFKGWVTDITRMKGAPSFDQLDNHSFENHEFGDAYTDYKHFSDYSVEHSQVNGEKADIQIIKMMNPMYYLDNPNICHNFRIRHGECDRDTSLAISYILTLSLKEKGIDVDYHSPWNTPHSGDYDLDELFAWIDKVSEK